MSQFETSYRIAFTGWNPFQFRHVKNIAKCIPGSMFIVEDRNNGNLSYFEESFFESYTNPVVIVKKGDMYKLDGDFDAIITQVVFHGIQKIEKSKIVMLQYGYAKEPHNYGIWRSLADLNITYGPYASRKIGQYTPIAECGNPEADDWENPVFHQKSKEIYGAVLDPSKKTILYAPTWGDLSSIELYLDKIISLGSKYNVIIKMHHNTDIIEKRSERIKKMKNILLYGAKDNIFSLLSVSDLMISDYSGALFDGFYCKKPLVLLNSNITASIKTDSDSLEIKRREELGSTVCSPEELDDIDNLYACAAKKAGGELWNQLFIKSYGYNAQKSAIAILEAASGRFQLTSTQRYLREIVKKVNYSEFK